MSDKTYKAATECQVMPEVRQAIDTIDAKIIALLGERLRYIDQAAQIKQSEDLVRDEERINSMLLVREKWAAENNYDPAFIRHLFNELIEYSIAKELKVWRQK